MEVVDIVWLAGYLEGEGSFLYYKPARRMTGYPVISVQSADYDVMLRVCRILKASGITRLSPKE